VHTSGDDAEPSMIVSWLRRGECSQTNDRPEESATTKWQGVKK